MSQETEQTGSFKVEPGSCKHGTPSGSGYGRPPFEAYPHELAHLLDLPKEAAYTSGGNITGLIIRQIPAGWQAILKRTHRGQRQVAFLDADTWGSLIVGIAEWTSKGLWHWYADKY